MEKEIKLAAGLPDVCYSLVDKDFGQADVIILKKGEVGYYKSKCPTMSKKDAKEIVEKYNNKLGLTAAQVAAMENGSMFGWNCLAADPANYNYDGTIKNIREIPFTFEEAEGKLKLTFNEEFKCYIGSIEWQGVKGTISFRDESHLNKFLADENGEMTRFINGLCFGE